MRKILIILLFAWSPLIYGQNDTIYTGSVPGTGEFLNTAFPKINAVIRLLNNLQLYNDSTTYLERNKLIGITGRVQPLLNGKAPINNTTLTGLTKLQLMTLNKI
jgi:hypothetical protein